MRVVSFRSVDRIANEFGDLTVNRVPKERYPEDDLIDRASGADGLFVHSENEYTTNIFETLSDLKVIGKAGSGIDNIDVDAATENDIVVLHTPGMNGVAVAEFTVGVLISFARRIPTAETHLRTGGWRSESWWGTELRDKTVGIVGLGAAGFETARRLEPFGVELLVADPYVDSDRVRSVNGTRVPFDELLAESDIVSFHVRLTEETEGMLGADGFDLLDDKAILVNTSRGEVIDQTALYDALEADAIGGAVLDVFHEEPPNPSDPVFDFENVLTTPHLAGATVETRVRMLATTARHVRKILHGEPVDEEYVANPTVLDS